MKDTIEPEHFHSRLANIPIHKLRKLRKKHKRIDIAVRQNPKILLSSIVGGGEKFKFVGSCQTCSRIVSERPVVSAAQCLQGLVVTTELGRGDIGVAYELKPGVQNTNINHALSDKATYVLKEVIIKNAKELKKFEDEVCIGKYLGEMGLAPRIYNCWVCVQKDAKKQFPLKGYYIMEKIHKIWEEEYPSHHPEASRDSALNHTAPKKVQQQLVAALERMISAGIIHQDCHPGNIGIMQDGRIVLFDFGFSLVASEPIPDVLKNTILMSQIYIVIEKWNRQEMYDSYLYGVIYDLRRNEHTWKH